jgi:hypothetical protein
MNRRPARKKVPKRNVKIACVRQRWLCACGCKMGIKGRKITVDHNPALGLREVNEDGNDYIPPQTDPAYLDIYLEAHDHRKTYGSGGTMRIETRSGDIGKISHTKSLRQRYAEHKAIMKAKHGG